MRLSDIPMTGAIAALPRVGSMPLPYTTLSVDEDGRDHSMPTRRPDGSQFLDCSCTLGEDRPVLGKPCPHRQRQAMRHRRCVVCGRRMPPTEDLVFIGVGLSDVEGYGPDTYTGVEPPAHRHCTAYSALACPRLASDPEHVTLAITRRYEIRQHVVLAFDKNGRAKGRLSKLDDTITTGCVDLYVAIPHPAATQFISLAQWMSTAAPKRYRELYHQQRAEQGATT